MVPPVGEVFYNGGSDSFKDLSGEDVMDIACPRCKTVIRTTGTPAAGKLPCTNCGHSFPWPPSTRSNGPSPASLPGPPDDDEATLRAGFPAGFPTDLAGFGRPRFRTEQQALDKGAPKGLIAFGIVGIFGLIFFFATFRRLVGPSEWFGPDTMSRTSAFFLCLFIALPWTVLSFGFGVYFFRKALLKTKVYAVVFANGFVHFDGQRFVSWRWDDIATVNIQRVDQRNFVYFIQVDRFQATSYDLHHRDGSVYSFWSTQGERAAQFGVLAETITFERMMPVARSGLQSGRPVEFRPFRMDATGLTFREHFSPWSNLGRMTLHNGSLRIDGAGPNGGTAQVLLGKIDNAHVFLPLLQEKAGRPIGD